MRLHLKSAQCPRALFCLWERFLLVHALWRILSIREDGPQRLGAA
jgi:hypothetical protein